jgi:hypothetical protein
MAKNLLNKKHSHEDLEALYVESTQCDQEVFAEQRTALLLIAGEHYNRTRFAFNKRLRDQKDVSEQQKLRLTKNHIQRIVKTYCNNILTMAPGVSVAPKNESEIQDQKAAELHQAVWMDMKDRYKFGELIDDWCDDFVGTGEVAVKIFWDPNKGKIKHYKQKMDGETPLYLDNEGEETKEPALDPVTSQPTNRPAPGEPVYSGEFVYETINGFNLHREASAKDMRKSPYLMFHKMVGVDELKAAFPDQEKKIQAGSDETYQVFDAAKGGYRKSENEVLVREWYWRPCHLYPRGYFYIQTKEGILAEGELPGGIFPIIFQPFDKLQTTPRGIGPVKIMRPYQAEINRAASKIAEHQITLGDDKLVFMNGSKPTAGASFPGMRTFHATGGAPIVMAGRDGSQYLAYMQANIEEMYKVMMVQEDTEEKTGQLDPHALLFRAASQKKQFQRYIKRFERFLTEVCLVSLKLAKIHLPDDEIIYAIGKKEQVNISEFKNSDDICYQIKLEPVAEDIETKVGRQLVLNQTLQYVGNKLDKEDIGKIMRAMPYANFEASFDDMTIDFDSVTNDILALDRGDMPQPHEYDNHVYAAKRLAARKRQADFRFLPPPVQANYDRLIGFHEQAEAEKQAAAQAATAGYIPTSGYLVSCDFYMPKPGKPTETQRVRLPSDAVTWMIKKLEAQGTSLQPLLDDGVPSGMRAEIAQKMSSMQNPAGGAPNGMGVPPAMQLGAAMPGGVDNVIRNGAGSPGHAGRGNLFAVS